ncbi:CBM96 family carbohydrate-binding protein [Mangrovihabitans endophyticus]|uniref:GH26 domain-containing protein n=1 Tax=Mangrovihabitans endophyticus TaxID=1751298 RepID=A0A8J3BW51_9ACTN|nr:DNRLRE domain-containing protein [Mangrovihabitans endophyticus]GGK83067.1 hypothetical protein GCM10012284_16510 [Mangrovihabitans endophyticus]
MAARRALITATLACVMTAGGLAAPAYAATSTEVVRVYAAHDAYVSSARPHVNFGLADKLAVGRLGKDTKLSYVKFRVPALPDGNVTRVQLRLPVASSPAESKLSVYPVSTRWSEKTITASNAPSLGSQRVSLVPRDTDTIIKFDVSKFVRKAGTYAFALKSSSRTEITRLRSVEYGNPDTGGPELRVTVTRELADPEPATEPVVAPEPVVDPEPAAPEPADPEPTTSEPTTSEPTTSEPTATEPEPVPGEPTGTEPTGTEPGCVTGALLVPSCGVLWGAAAGGFTTAPRDEALRDWEALTGRTASIFHAYHKGDQKFPTAAEIAMTRDPEHPRVLLLNWKVAYGSTWAKVAAGEQDERIDNWAAYVKANYPDQKFFLALHHEPENDVQPWAGSGMTAKDYAAMYRHVIQRLRADGVTNAVNVVAYMGNEKWMAQSWWGDLYPGDDVVDWMGLDSYVSAEPGYYHYGDFGDLLDREPSGGGTGWYDWAVANHASKPIMVAEWGVYHRLSAPYDKAPAFRTVVPELKEHPQVKAIVYFDTPKDDSGDRNIAVDSTQSSLTAFRELAADPMFEVDIRH